MWRYVVKRLLWLIVIMVCVAVIIFSIVFFMPGEPAKIILGTGATAADIERLNHQLGLDQPFIVQLKNFLLSACRLDLGTSYVYKTPVMDEFLIRLPRTLMLGIITIIISTAIGIPLGVNAAIHRNSFQDQGVLVLAMVFISMPQFWLGLLMVILFAVELKWLPPFGITGAPFADWQYWVLPVIANTLSGLAMNARQTRSAALETIRADFVTTARAKGLPENTVIYKHMLPNALIPVINGLGMQLSMMVGGTVVIESVFSFPGVGMYLLDAVNGRDRPVIQGCVLVLALFSAVVTLLVDLVYAYLDPRIKAQYVNYAAKKGGKKNAG